MPESYLTVGNNGKKKKKKKSDDVLNYNWIKLQTGYQESLKSVSYKIFISVKFLFYEFIQTYNL